jgi:spore germination protein GerM
VKRRWLVVAVCLVLVGCGQAQSTGPSAPSTPVSTAPGPASLAPSTAPLRGALSPSSRATAATEPAALYFTSGSKLARVPSQVSPSSPARQAPDQLFRGPPDARHSTEIPAGAHLQDISIEGRVATASFDSAFFTPDGATGTLLRLAQVVYTLTQFPPIASVRFLKDGEPVDLIGEGFPLNRPLSRQDFSHVQP